MHDHIVQMLQRRIPAAMALQIPPPCFLDMEGEFLNFDEAAKQLTARFPVRRRYENPLGYVQGGFLAAMMDNVAGPLSFLVAPPSVTTQFNTTYIRPVTGQIDTVTVVAWVTEQTKRQIFIQSHILTPEDKVAAFALLSCNMVA